MANEQHRLVLPGVNGPQLDSTTRWFGPFSCG